MNIYEENSDHFNPEYLAWLKTLDSRTGTGRYRITTDPEGDVVAIEFWDELNSYFNFRFKDSP